MRLSLRHLGLLKGVLLFGVATSAFNGAAAQTGSEAIYSEAMGAGMFKFNHTSGAYLNLIESGDFNHDGTDLPPYSVPLPMLGRWRSFVPSEGCGA